MYHLSLIGLWRHGTDKRVPLSPGAFAQIIHQARLHDEDALVTLYQRALPMVYRYVLARLGQADLAEDVVSDVFLVMVEAIGQPGQWRWPRLVPGCSAVRHSTE